MKHQRALLHKIAELLSAAEDQADVLFVIRNPNGRFALITGNPEIEPSAEERHIAAELAHQAMHALGACPHGPGFDSDDDEDWDDDMDRGASVEDPHSTFTVNLTTDAPDRTPYH